MAATPEPVKGDARGAVVVALRVLGLLAALYVFLLGLALMGDAFQALGGKGAGRMFQVTDNPIAGLMVGVLATVMVQSSSTSTSIVVGLVGADQLTVSQAIPVIMGANIGTSVTNTIVSMSSVGNKLELEAAFSGATVHDMFNWLTVLTLLPVELLIQGLSGGEGGMLYWLTKGLSEAIMSGNSKDATFESPVKAVVKPVSSAILKNDKNVIKALSMHKPDTLPTPASANISSSCASTAQRRLDAEQPEMWDGWHLNSLGERAAGNPQEQIPTDSARRLAAGQDCSTYTCVSDDMAKLLKKLNKDGYAALPTCGSFISTDTPLCASSSADCVLGFPAFYDAEVQGGVILAKGWLSELGDMGGGILGLILSLVLLCGALAALVKLLHSLLKGQAQKFVQRAVNMHPAMAILAGCGLTILVQSSSVVTSALTPLCAIGVLKLDGMFPLTLGANIGTTITGLLAAVAVFKATSLQIALCHTSFNVIGIMIWYPLPFMRRIPLAAARTCGMYASFFRFVPLLYILVAFVALPGVALLVSLLYNESVAAGVVVTLLVLGAALAFAFWWNKIGCYKVISQEDREKHEAAREKRLEELAAGKDTDKPETQGDIEAPVKEDAEVATGSV